MKIKTVAVLGAGAVGSYVIWGLSRRKDIRLGVLAEGKRAEKLKKGCTINGEVYHPEVWTPQEAKGVDLLIVSLKYGALPGAMDSIRQVTGENTTVMSLMNGVDSEKLISDEIGASHVIYSVIKVASHKEENGYCFNPETTIGIIFGEPCAPYDSERVQAIEALFADTGLHYRSTEYIREEIWSKFRLNVCNNLPQAILGAGVGCYQDSVHMKAISDGLRRELEAIAAAKGIAISKAAASSGHGSAVPPSARYSTLQDLGVTDKKIITLFNKCDRVTGDEVLQDFRADKTLRISAKTGQGLDTLKEVFEDLLRDGKVLLKHTFPYEKAGEIQKIRKYGELLKEEYTPDGIYVEAYVPPEL